MNMEIWEVGTLNQLFIRSSYTDINFFNKNKLVETLRSL